MIRVDCISDLHGYKPILPGGDLLIIAGDLTAKDQEWEYFEFFDWLDSQAYSEKIFIGGNHDAELQKQCYEGPAGNEFIYLCDSGTEFKGLKIWGSPWTKKFYGQNPKAMAFCVDEEEELENQWSLIPSDIDILITHAPPFGILDQNFHRSRVGSYSLREWVFGCRPNLKLVVFGHIHENGGQQEKIADRIFVNASVVDMRYRLINGPTSIELPIKE